VYSHQPDISGWRTTQVKTSIREEGPTDKIPPSIPLGQILKYWSDNLRTKDKKKQQKIKYCCFFWTYGSILKSGGFWVR
jgi:hypothetical protein